MLAEPVLTLKQVLYKQACNRQTMEYHFNKSTCSSTASATGHCSKWMNIEIGHIDVNEALCGVSEKLSSSVGECSIQLFIHTAVLPAASPVFRAMHIFARCEGETCKEVESKSINPKSWRSVIQYIDTVPVGIVDEEIALLVLGNVTSTNLAIFIRLRTWSNFPSLSERKTYCRLLL
jgi:hypothetical protein